MGWKKTLPKDLFCVSQNGLVIPRFISRPLFSIVFLTLILLVVSCISLVGIYSGRSFYIPESTNCLFQFVDEPSKHNFLVIAYLRPYSEMFIPDISIADPDSPALPCELSRLFLDKADWIKHLQVPFLQKSHFFNMGYIENSHKLYLYADMLVQWGEIVSLLKAAQKAGVRDVCFLTEERLKSCD